MKWPRGISVAAFHPRLLGALKGYSRETFFADLSAGLTVGVVALPLAMAFGIASGVKPEQGLFTAIIAGFLISALGGSQVQIGGPAGAFIVIVYGIVERYGLANLLIATILSGGILFFLGLFRMGALVRYIPLSIVIGFTNGIAVLIGLSQVKEFLGLTTPKMPSDFFAQIKVLTAHIDSFNPTACVIGLSCLAIVVVWPKSYAEAGEPGWWSQTRQVIARLPGTIVALVGATVVVTLLHLDVATIGSRFGGIPQGLPSFALPELSWESAKHLLMPALTIAMLGAIESLLCARVADNQSSFERHDPNQELMAQGVANFVVPFFGGIPATGTIARTLTNVRAGAQTPIAGIVHALTLLVIVLVAAPLAMHVPLAGLAGVLMFVAWNMGEWREFVRLKNFSLQYRTILLGTFITTVVFDLTVAVELGLVLACLFFVYRMSSLFRVEPLPGEGSKGTSVISLYGALFFGAVGKLEDLPKHLSPETRVLILDAHRLIAMDTTGLDALGQMCKGLQQAQVRVILCGLNEQPSSLIHRAGFAQVLGEHNLCADLNAALAAAAT